MNQKLPANVAGGIREIDIVMTDALIQVKSKGAGGLARQVRETRLTLGSDGRRVIGYAPDNFSNNAWRSAAEQGIPIARNFDELVAILKETR